MKYTRKRTHLSWLVCSETVVQQKRRSSALADAKVFDLETCNLQWNWNKMHIIRTHRRKFILEGWANISKVENCFNRHENSLQILTIYTHKLDMREWHRSVVRDHAKIFLLMLMLHRAPEHSVALKELKNNLGEGREGKERNDWLTFHKSWCRINH